MTGNAPKPIPKLRKSSSKKTLEAATSRAGSFRAHEAAAKTAARRRLAAATSARYTSRMKEAVAWARTYASNEEKEEAARCQFAELSGFPDDETGDKPPDEITTPMDPEFYAFDGAPKECTPKAIAMFLWHKCFEAGCKPGTADQVYSAIKKHYDLLDGDKYRSGVWRFDESTKQWLGN
ncbi:hypothetical protein CC1G_13379 [Coprinopsis cinerea okayama7|uniref:Uncharacterized protein n=1 Tax=Coprinopsis cinerea (strain Okayama-7 / 130 / ATCC MYA-4618 / FGSC 9003) TaxID=240176 RepID=A8NZ87_COPC7|nr:hypothetical protein CC1G_13379 [Coprinopsis cinerea okayama7\|eukprot:XP_001837631.1 hypothetical protein CC1G_13379 [Coprinopsis cinerea okayama7\